MALLRSHASGQLGSSHTGGGARYCGKCWHQASAQAERQIYLYIYMLPTSALTHQQHTHSRSACAVPQLAKFGDVRANHQNGFIQRVFQWRRSLVNVWLLVSMLPCWKVRRKWVIWRFEPSQLLGIISGLEETFIKRYIAERTYETEVRPEEQSEKTETCWENLWNEIQVKGPWRQMIQEQNWKEWASSVGFCCRHKA